MSKMQVKIDGEAWEKGKLFIHGDEYPEGIINTNGKCEVDIEGIKKGIEKYFEDMVRKENENAKNKGYGGKGGEK